MEKYIDFRSDTVTKPGEGMLNAMVNAKVGDDVYGEDPSVNQLEQRLAAFFNMEAALFCPSGTMSNQIAIKAHTNPGDELICEKNSHVFQYEGGGIAFNSGVQVNTVHGNRGMIQRKHIEPVINNRNDIHKATTSLISLENTSNRGGGACYHTIDIEDIRGLCNEYGLMLHLDGARLFNALAATGQDPKFYGENFDSISVCLNKGLGCPAGSVLLGREEYILKARRIRKVLGGGMRQAGYIAACGLYALENNYKRLKNDHDNARKIGDALSSSPFINNVLPVETNIVIAEMEGQISTRQFLSELKKAGFLAGAISTTQVRFVTHLDISDEATEKLVKFIKDL